MRLFWNWYWHICVSCVGCVGREHGSQWWEIHYITPPPPPPPPPFPAMPASSVGTSWDLPGHESYGCRGGGASYQLRGNVITILYRAIDINGFNIINQYLWAEVYDLIKSRIHVSLIQIFIIFLLAKLVKSTYYLRCVNLVLIENTSEVMVWSLWLGIDWYNYIMMKLTHFNSAYGIVGISFVSIKTSSLVGRACWCRVILYKYYLLTV